ncbi:peptide/nickel transport system ATP-binding protein/glutathione transport system ATP-binding protein [Loktanella atrilutea]|uniref:Peptide/nickel transport system ATP-binding protein/glutathione transport system ATP-binding protein n=1 Tax=Loktanella atrilutea TaxID=366533 RepID=A0A1M4TCA9_LOKAT|nr:ABC transporter ATP-binding protein [Loktanella atrilutea]SHE42106.1 peptide/nickel transport system ATP-binding protein/glutathione transport system ATP-binding protein [Loktanella atrilutea]
MTDPIVTLDRLRVTFGAGDATVTAVKDVSFSIAPGETVCVVGESGSGKSVTSLSLMRLVEFGGGSIVDGRLTLMRPDGAVDLAQADTATMRGIRGHDIGMIFQEPMTSLNPVFTIERQLTDGLRLHLGLSAAAARDRALALLKEVRIPEPERRLKQYPHELSGGMRQRVVIAIAMACAPRLLIADEPTTALDVTIQAEILALINRLKREKGMAVMFITHDMAVVAQIADRVVVMYRGDVVEEGPVADIFANPKADYTKALLAAVPRLGEMRGKPAPEPLRLVGDDRAPQPLTPAANPEPLLEVNHLTTYFPVRGGPLRRHIANIHAVEDVSFTLNKGETLSLVGESGCGKSSCGRSILRLVEPASGSVILDRKDVLDQNPRDLRRLRRDMQMIFQDPFASLNPYMRLSAQVAEPLRNFGLAAGSELTDRVAALFDRVDLPRSYLRRFPHELSGGQRQRVAIARALAVNPKLIIADEAVSALDVSVQAQVLNLMMELQADLGLSFLFISHDMAVVERVSHHVAVMYLGRIVEIGPRAAIFENPQHAYTRTLLRAVPIADPGTRKLDSDLSFTPIPSPMHDLTYRPAPSTYDTVAPGHLVLRENA